MKRTKPIRRKTPLRRVSKKRAKESRIYSAKRRAFLEAHPICGCGVQRHLFGELFVCQRRAVDVHHTKGRTGGNYLDEKTWLAVCRPHHIWIHNNPSKARKMGLLT